MIKNIFAAITLAAFSTTVHAQFSWSKLPEVKPTSFKKDSFNIVKYGAVSNGTILNTESISKAIKACNANGGGVVVVPFGIWLTGPLELKSNVNLYVQKGAMLLFTDDKTKYEIVAGSYEGRSSARNQSPIWAKNAENIAITGGGVIDGNGDIWRGLTKSAVTESFWNARVKSGGVLSTDGKKWYPSEQFKQVSESKRSMLLEPGKPLSDYADMKDFLRPNLLVLTQCKRILLEGVTFQNSGAWNLHPLMSEDLIIRNVTVKNPDYSHNGDGLDIESCKNFIVEDCVFDVGDDAICIKSGKDEEGRKRGMPTQNGIIRNNLVYKGHGGVVVGSEMSGGTKNIFIENCLFIGTDKGLRFKSARGRGGVVEKVYARNIQMRNIDQEAIFFDMHYAVTFATDGVRKIDTTFGEGTPVFRDMEFENIVCDGAKKGIFVRGLPEAAIQNIRIKNTKLITDIGAELILADGIVLDHVTFESKQKDPVVLVDNSSNIEINKSLYPTDTKLFLKVLGSKNIKVDKTLVNTRDVAKW
ncbi:glycoside hydrolase family 28 protein [Niabella sp. CJ426]|uniref:glycoside hydrolase family 28 protein n=1 Tax=Niabella sp. CJ426 TaxID=3393740 RepID=UPI003CFE87CC